MHLTFEGRQDGDKSGSRDRPTDRAIAGQEGLQRERPSTGPGDRPRPSFGVFVAVVRRRKTDALPPATRPACRRVDWTVELSSSEDGACGPRAPASSCPPGVTYGIRCRSSSDVSRSRRHAVSLSPQLLQLQLLRLMTLCSTTLRRRVV